MWWLSETKTKDKRETWPHPRPFEKHNNIQWRGSSLFSFIPYIFICFYASNVMWRSRLPRRDCLSWHVCVLIKVATADVDNANDVWCDQQQKCVWVISAQSSRRPYNNKMAERERESEWEDAPQNTYFVGLELVSPLAGQFGNHLVLAISKTSSYDYFFFFCSGSGQVVITGSSTSFFLFWI